MYQLIIPLKTNEINEVRKLFIEYQKELGHDLCFQDFRNELDTLPGKYKEPDGHLLLLKDEQNETIAGCIALKKFEKDICEMKRLYVKPQFRHKGYGRILVTEMLNVAREKGYKEMILDTLEILKPAIQLYKKFGFKITKPYYHNPLEGVVYMSKEIK